MIKKLLLIAVLSLSKLSFCQVETKPKWNVSVEALAGAMPVNVFAISKLSFHKANHIYEKLEINGNGGEMHGNPIQDINWYWKITDKIEKK